MKPLHILFISSLPPQRSAGLALEYMKALEHAGHQVDFLTKYNYIGRRKNDIYVYHGLKGWIRELGKKVGLQKFIKLLYLLPKGQKSYRNLEIGISITNMYEDKPFVNPKDILKVITKQYDVVITLFWEYMLSTVSLKAIYDKLHCPIIISSVDMATYTGGCFYFLNCRNFAKGCGCCPALNSTDPNDQTHKNFLLKKQMYASMNYAIGLNTWMQQYARETGLFETQRIITTSMALDENHFVPMDQGKCRDYLNIPKKKRFVLFARAVAKHAIISKGFDLLAKSVNEFISRNSVDKEQVLLLLAGRFLSEEELLAFSVDIKHLGYVDTETLIKVYNASDAFLSPSIDDAGPSMVNQSIMCGTPVVCYDIGTAWDVIYNGKSGFKVPVKDYMKFADAIETIYKMGPSDYHILCSNAREIALKNNSLKSFAEMVESTYNKLKDLD